MTAEKRPIPADPITGLAYPFILLDHVPNHTETWYDYHHNEFEHMNPLLRGQGGRAVRYSMGQLMMRWQHNLGHHLGDEPDLPKTRDEQFRASVFGVARLVGSLGIDLRREDWWNPVEMTPAEYALVTDSTRMFTQDAYKPRGRRIRDDVGRFYAAYALEQDLSHVSRKAIRQFLSTSDPARKKELGNWLLAEAIDVAVDPIKPAQRRVLERRPLQAGRVDLRRAVRGFFVGRRFADYYGTLATRLVDIAWV
jgi:hypothetical protein